MTVAIWKPFSVAWLGHRLRSALLFCAASGLSLLSCEREDRDFHVDPPSANTAAAARVGPPIAATLPATMPSINTLSPPVRHNYEKNAYAIAEGQRLYNAFNCVGCHAHGGGGIGPALMDELWIHGSEPEVIFGGIVDGWPDGMPAFRGKIPDYQVWQIVA
ncbi:MAG TPA: cytochrome c, partial [Tepidisphaeraceae bacterium]|nr:cytochrome c [Tepidisphaeraceae bacterium]